MRVLSSPDINNTPARWVIIAAVAAVAAGWLWIGSGSREQALAGCKLEYADHEARTMMIRLCMESRGYDMPKAERSKNANAR